MYTEIYKIQKLNISYINVRKVLNKGSYVQCSARFFPHNEATPEERKTNKHQIMLVKQDIGISIKIVFFLLLKNLLFSKLIQ